MHVTRLAAFAFGELVETSATLESLGEARSGRARHAYFDVVRIAIASAGGRELETVGDGVLAVFESPSDALSFASAVQRGCERESRRAAERLDVRVGIDVGETASDDGSAAQEALAAARARHLARAADSGSVLASGVVATLAAGADARFSPVGLLDLPGVHEPVPAFEVRWERPAVEQAPLPAELERAVPQTPFVGREAEQERLGAIWRLALRGERQLAFVAGEPGIGKTRLVAEFVRDLHEDGAVVLWGRSSEEVLSPYQPFVQALRHHVRSAPLEELREQVGASVDLLARLLPDVRSRLPVPELSPVEEPESERYRLFEAVGHLLAVASGERPIVLALDDLQWADQGTLLLLKHVARDPVPAPLLLLGTYRQSEIGRDHPLALVKADVERDRIVELIELSGLAEEEITTLVGSLVGWNPPSEVARSLHGETGGNPFFLEEVVRHLEQLGLSADPERLAGVTATVREIGVPARVRELVGRRVQRLTRPGRETLAAAAVIGSEPSRDVLSEVLQLESDQELGAALDELVDARLLAESPDRIGRYRFSHALIQHALYEEQTLNRRATLHEQVGAALERLRPEDGELHAALAYHYARAGDQLARKVVRHGRTAGEHALGLFAYEDAIRELTVALTALESSDGADRRERAELLALLGTARTRAGDYPAARVAFHEAAELSAATGTWPTLAHAALGFGGGSTFGGVWETLQGVDLELVRLLERALAAAPAGDSLERVRLLARLAQALYWIPEAADRALLLSDEAVATARRLRDSGALAYALDSRRVVLWSPDRLDEGRALAEEILAIGRELGDRDIQLEALVWLITDALERGSITVVDHLIAEYERIAAELRQHYHLWFTQVLRAMRAHLDGRFDDAVALSQQAYAYGGHALGQQALQVHLAQALFLWLDQGRAEELLEEIGNHPAAWPDRLLHAALALSLAGLDRREEALAEVERVAEQGLSSIPRDVLWTTTIVALSRAIAHLDDPTHAEELYELLLPYADRIGVTGGPVLCLGPVSRILGMLARAGGRPDTALEHFADALDRSRALGSPPLVARTQLETAKAFLLRDGPGDRERAQQLLPEARATASGLRMAKLLHDIDALQSSLGRGALA